MLLLLCCFFFFVYKRLNNNNCVCSWCKKCGKDYFVNMTSFSCCTLWVWLEWYNKYVKMFAGIRVFKITIVLNSRTTMYGEKEEKGRKKNYFSNDFRGIYILPLVYVWTLYLFIRETCSEYHPTHLKETIAFGFLLEDIYLSCNRKISFVKSHVNGWVSEYGFLEDGGGWKHGFCM